MTEAGDGLALWGVAEIHTDLETKHRLWHGVFDYDLNLPSPGGPDASPERAFVAIRPERAVFLPNYGAGVRETWSIVSP